MTSSFSSSFFFLTRAFARLTLLLSVAFLLSLSLKAHAEHGDFHKTEEAARGQTVWFAAWAGSDKINAYLRWVAEQVQARYGVELKHFKLSNTADAVKRVLAEKSAGKNTGGGIDLIWINGENFRTMKEQKLLFGPFAARLPNWKYVDTKNKPATTMDFTIPTEGYESPWGMAQLVLIRDTERVAKAPRSLKRLAAYAKKNQGRFTYPAPPDFVGVTFLKQALYDLGADRETLAQPASDATFAQTTKPLWDFLDALHPSLWQGGRSFPKNWPHQNQLLNDGEIYFSLTFNPGDVASSIADGTLPDTARGFCFQEGHDWQRSLCRHSLQRACQGGSAGRCELSPFCRGAGAQGGLDPLGRSERFGVFEAAESRARAF